jgi:hypothetical protein
MHRAFWFNTDAGAYWSVLDDADYSVVELPDRFLQFMRFARGRAESTTRKYAEGIALYYRFCSDRSTSWTDPDMTAFQMWLKVAPSSRHPDPTKRVWAGPGHAPARSDNRINLISYAVCEMFKFAAVEGMWPEAKLNRLFEMAPVQDYGPSDQRHYLSTTTYPRVGVPLDGACTTCQRHAYAGRDHDGRPTPNRDCRVPTLMAMMRTGLRHGRTQSASFARRVHLRSNLPGWSSRIGDGGGAPC